MAPPLRFGTDGVRGIAGDDLTPENVYLLARAAARVLGVDRPYLIARDTRESGPWIEESLAGGLRLEGAAVESVGVFPTPGLAFLAQQRDVRAAMISASHNPFRDNGIKLFGPGGRKLPDVVERRIEAEMEGLPDDPPSPAALPPALPPAPRAVEDYLDHVIEVTEGRRLDGLSVVVDCANGAACGTAPAALRRLGAQVDVIAAEPDGVNINEGCGSTHPGALQRAVVASSAAAGLAFDGDADRVIAVDERGELVDGDQIMAIAALDLETRGRLDHDTVVATVMSNLGFHHAMEEAGIRVVQTKVGDRYVVEAMDEGGYVLGGEQSGHIIFAERATTGDGLLSGLVVLDVMARTGRPLSDLARVVTRLPQVLENVPVIDREAVTEADDFWESVRAVERELGRDGRVLVRPSGTEPVVRIMVEATTQEEAEASVARLADALTAELGRAGSGGGR